MDRDSAISWLARNAKGLIDLATTNEICRALGVRLNDLVDIEHDLVQTPGVGSGWVRLPHGRGLLHAKMKWCVSPEGEGRSLVQVSELAATTAQFMGLYANHDHARQSPHGTRGKEAQYVGQRAALRMARHFHPDGSGERDLLSEVPSVMEAGVGTAMRDTKKEKVFNRDGTPVIVGKDALIRERIYKP